MGKIVIIGSINIDLVAKVDHIPISGETIGNAQYFKAFGGKGANQAVAAARTGGEIFFISAIGDDSNGRETLSNFSTEGVDVSGVKICSNTPTGTALIFVDKNGENCIAVAPGANKEVTGDFIKSHEKSIQDADILVMQMEIPYGSIKTAFDIADKYKIKIFLNPAPAIPIEDELLLKLDWLVLNEYESEIVSGLKISEVGIENVSETLFNKGVKNVVITLGSKGCYVKNESVAKYFPAFKVNALDTTAAGDTFCGSLATRIVKGDLLEDSIRFATAASAISVTRNGAQPSIPKSSEVFKFLECLNN